MAETLIAFCTFPDRELAAKITKELVELHLAACGNILPQVHSIYQWQGKIESSDEILVLFKLDGHRYAEFESRIRSLHPYEVPEIIAFPLTKGLPAYLRWVADSCAG
jgi:periplasmic divalent cation tolerance protein